MKFLIIGADAAGMSAASRAKRNMSSMDVTVLEMTGDVSYSACGMPYNIADPERPIDDLVVRKAAVFREKQGIDLRTGHRAETIDPAGKVVTAATGLGTTVDFAYDHLLIATGARPIIPDIPGMDLPGVMALKSLADGRRIKEYLATHPAKKAVILGMGYIGFEMAEALRARSIDVTMVKPRPVVLPWMAEELSKAVREEVVTHGVELLAGYDIQRIELKKDRLDVVCEGRTVSADLVLVAIGVYPNSEMARTAGLELGPGDAIAVDRRLQTSDPLIYAAGDCADSIHVVTDRKTWIPLALRANRAGWAVADNISGTPAELDGVAGTAVFKVFDLEVARTGLSLKEAVDAGFDPVEVVIQTRSKAHGHPGNATIHVQMVGDRETGRLIGAQMVGREGAAHRINAAAVALHNRMTVAGFFQTDLAYAPPFGPVWDPLLTAANVLQKKMGQGA